jgi:hypothetical protein
MLRRIVWVALLIGCGDDGAAPRDAAIDAEIDASMIDAPPPPLDHYYYVVDKVSVPTTNTQARAYGLDLNTDGTVDNQLGMVLSTLSSMGFELQVAQDKAIDTGAELLLADLNTTDFTNAAGSTFTLYQGSNPMPPACKNAQDTVCRRHLTGMASFTALATAIDPPLTGTFVNGTLSAGPGHLTIQIVWPDAPPATVTLLGARAKASTVSASAIGAAILAGGVTMADVNGKIIPAMQVGFMAAVTRDCTMLSSPPSCGCAQDSAGKTNLGLFDANHDCAISIDEVRNNSLIVSLLSPDVTLESQQCLSIGLQAHAVPAGFIAP